MVKAPKSKSIFICISTISSVHCGHYCIVIVIFSLAFIGRGRRFGDSCIFHFIVSDKGTRVRAPSEADLVHRDMQFVSAYPAHYMQPSPVLLYPNERPMSFNHQFALGTEDIMLAGQRDAESQARRRVTRQQAVILENAFNENPKPNRNVRQELAQVLAISPRNVQVRILFQNSC